MGDPAGIGPELCLRILGEPQVLAHANPVIFGDAAILERVASATGLPRPPLIAALHQPVPTTPAVIDCATLDADAVLPGRVQQACGRASYLYIEHAVRKAMAREVDCIATAPINKEAIRLAGVTQPGHTEILADLTGSPRVCMMLASDVLTVSMVTTHIGLRDVPGKLTPARVEEVIHLTADAMRRVHGRPPRLGVCGLNPHAGENGLFGGGEEERAIVPAIEAARARGVDVEGPIPPDTAFVDRHRAHLDAIVCMYHDQGHIPFKMLAFDTGVNITLGLPITRVSVDHGTAFDIAWQGKANVTSLIEAVLWSARLGSARLGSTAQ
ncbi:MAG: 4-hydroxythreonine-4-phosphate dehydrogenase PdxA [Acidobacteria bacterium]|nr:4-hydroxythreonine-4-phosphate dehydrogenase PdxA [Acidobacteriota bacterium]